MGYLFDLIKESGRTQADVARALSVTRQAVQGWCSTDRLPSQDKLLPLSNLLGVSIDDLLARRKARSEFTDYIEIPHIAVKGSCGSGVMNCEESKVATIKVSKAWLRVNAPGANRSSLNIIMADGGSMEPTIKSGDLLLVDLSKKEVVADAIYAISMDGMLYVKRIQRIGSKIRILSDNSAYPPFNVSDDMNVTVVGRIYCIGHFSGV